LTFCFRSFAGHSLVGQNHRAFAGRAAASADDVIIGGTTEEDYDVEMLMETKEGDKDDNIE
jgi:hypothetical protein